MEILARNARPALRMARSAGLEGTALLVLAIIVLLLGPGTGSAQARFELGLDDAGFGPAGSATQAATAYAAERAIHGSFARIPLGWAQAAPDKDAPHPPRGFQPADPSSAGYDWSRTDAAVRAAAQHHLKVILVINDAPRWAIPPGPEKPYVGSGAWDPNPVLFSRFMHAAARRYSGGFPDPTNPGARLPRVKYWEPWNEPNIPGFFSAPNPVAAYRTLLNDAYRQLKAVHRDNVVLLGGLAPVSPVPGSIPPLNFAAGLMCLRPAGSRFASVGSCRRAHFDGLAIHPYSLAATPTKHAYKRGDLLVGDTGKVRALLRAAGNRYQLWVTEFGWYTNPPNGQLGDAPQTAARYVAYSLYEMWKAGVSVVIWFTVLDASTNGPTSGAGLYSAPGQPKPTLDALAFPFVAGVGRGSGWAWGRVPTSRPQSVVVERAAGGRWVRVAGARTGSDGVFYVHFRAGGNGSYRAGVVGGPTSLSYDSTPIPPRRTHLYQGT